MSFFWTAYGRNAIIASSEEAAVCGNFGEGAVRGYGFFIRLCCYAGRADGRAACGVV